jgi:hypothetical protein
MIIVLVIMVVVTTFGLLKILNTTELRVQQNTRTAQALKEAKEAVIAFAAMSNTPGVMPCPEMTNTIGTTTDGASSPCANVGLYLGRLPWRTLKLAQYPDSTGEQLWYALKDFRSGAINNTSTGGLTVDGRQVVAIIFAPGPAQAGQTRPLLVQGGAAPLPSNYLDGTNADGDTVFSVNSSGINDLAITITVAELTAPIIRRVLAEAAGPNVSSFLAGSPPSTGLRRYYSENNAFPPPSPPLSGTFTGAFPYAALEMGTNTWLNNNGWYAQMTYTNDPLSSSALISLAGQSLRVQPCLVQPCL